jgi:glucose-6-phosphate 1-dehydrogenase
MSFNLVLFGGTGDLSWRKLMPALFQAFRHGTLQPGGRIIGVARDAMSDAQYRDLIRSRFDQVDLAKRPSAEEFERFAALLHYQRMDLSQPEAYATLAARLNERSADTTVIYLATSPNLFTTICEQLGSAGLNTPSTRVVLEKPLGQDLTSNRSINQAVLKHFSEKQVFRIDHYLGKPSVQNLLALRLPISRSLLPKTWVWKNAAAITMALARCATWCKTMPCNCCAPWPWSRPSTYMPMPSAMKNSRCYARLNAGHLRRLANMPCAASTLRAR